MIAWIANFASMRMVLLVNGESHIVPEDFTQSKLGTS